jgi:hypothetical protein
MPKMKTKIPLQELVHTSSCNVLKENTFTRNKFTSQPGNQFNQLTSHPRKSTSSPGNQSTNKAGVSSQVNKVTSSTVNQLGS